MSEFAAAGNVPGDEPIVLTADRRSWWRMLMIGVVFASIGVAMVIVERSVIAWLVTVLFGLLVAVAGMQLRNPATLEITATEIEVQTLGRRWSRDLASCSEFGVWENPAARQSIVVFDHPSDLEKRSGRLNVRLTGRSGALPDTYGQTAEELAALLNRARLTALADRR